MVDLMSAENNSLLNKIVVVWTSKSQDVARDMALDHTRYFQIGGFWDRVRLVIWGPSVRLFAEDEALQAELRELKSIGV
jgi:hypothetical protein